MSSSTEITKERFPDWDRNPRAPVPLPPSGSCDCQIHIYEDQRTYPVRWGIAHEVPDGKFADAQRVLRVLGFDRAVIVHASVYDTDYLMITDILRREPDRNTYRGVVVINETVKDKELDDLAALGVCGIRFHIAKRYAAYPKEAFCGRSIVQRREDGTCDCIWTDPICSNMRTYLNRSKALTFLSTTWGASIFRWVSTSPPLAGF